MDTLNLPITQAGLSVRSENCLLRAGIKTIGEMLEFPDDKLSTIRNLGSKSIAEILSKKSEYREIIARGETTPESADTDCMDVPEDDEAYNAWLQTSAGRSFVTDWLRQKNITADTLPTLSVRAYNLLVIITQVPLHRIIFTDAEQLMNIPRMDEVSAREIVLACSEYLTFAKGEILSALNITLAKKKNPSVHDMLHMLQYRDAISDYVRVNDISIEYSALPTRARNQLIRNGYTRLSDIIFMNRTELQEIRMMGGDAADATVEMINQYLYENAERIKAFCRGDAAALINDAYIIDKIRRLYNNIGFAGLSFGELSERLSLPDCVAPERLKKIIGSLIARGELEYVDFRCYRIYGSFSDALEKCPDINERNRDILRLRINGETLEVVAQKHDMTRERVRQIVKRDVQKVRTWYTQHTGMEHFDEDYFSYFYATYSIDRKDAAAWLGVSEYVFRYLDLIDVKRGKNELSKALEDVSGLDVGLRLKIKNYLNRNKLYIDGIWVEKKRSALEDTVARKFCTDDVSFTDFVQIYNDFLVHEEIAYDENICLTESVLNTRRNRLSESRCILWKMNETLRYYDMDGRDYTELLDTLNLDSFENVDISTEKFMRDYPELMLRYDIRDQYELHNLLRKIIPEGSYHNFRCSRTPMLKFGEFDRDAALLRIITDNAPISMPDLCDIIQDAYGYNPAVTQASYLQTLSVYYHNGMFTMAHKAMSDENLAALSDTLSENFYFFDEIREQYQKLIPGADTEEINPYNLKKMGFSVYSRYALRGFDSLEAYFTDMLTRNDITDLSLIRKRYTYVRMFSQTLTELRRNLDVIEFEPNQIINMRRLSGAGVTKENIAEFCSEVYHFVREDSYFSIHSLRQDGFEADLFDLGFSDWFYANLLISDDRFSFGNMLGNIILYKASDCITLKTFITDRIKAHGSIDIYDLMTELADRFGCRICDRWDLIYKTRDTEIYYDEILQRFYSSIDMYYRELDEGGI